MRRSKSDIVKNESAAGSSYECFCLIFLSPLGLLHHIINRQFEACALLAGGEYTPVGA